MENTQKRNSSIELLKVAAIIIIVFSHAMPVPQGDIAVSDDFAMVLGMATTSIQRLIILLMKYGGQFGNDIFMICSAWFLIDSKKAGVAKVLHMIGDCFLISVLFLATFLCFGYHLPTSEIVTSLFPTWTSANWFITCYMIVYLIHPALNIVIKKLELKQLLATVIMMLVLYSGFNYLVRETFYYNYLVGFICVYFITAYMKLYMEHSTKSVKGNLVLLIISTVGNLGIIGITNFLGLHIHFFSNKLTHWNAFISPFTLMSAISVFHLVRRYSFVNRGINYLSGLSMLIYIIHDNRLIIYHLIGYVFEYIYNTYTYEYELLWVLLYGTVSLLSATLLAVIYRSTLQKLVHKLCGLIYNGLTPLCDKLLTYCMKWK